MRIGLVCPYSFSRPGGVQGHVWGLGEHLVGRGHQVEVLAPGVPAPASHDRPAPGFTSAGPAVPVRWNGSVARVSCSPRTAGVVARWLARGHFDVVHVHEPVTPSIAWQALALADAPVVATSHAAREDTRLHAAVGRLFAERVRRIDVALAVSDVAADLAASYLPARPRIVPNGLWTTDFAPGAAPRPGPWRGGSRPRVTFLGRDEPRKGLDVLLRAADAIAGPLGAELVVAGAEGRALPPTCVPLDARDDAGRARLLAGTDVFVAPATGGESFGVVLVEALAAGCQVVASDLPAFRAVLADAGRTFPVGDAAALADGVAAALHHPVPGDVLATRAARFDWAHVGAEVEGVYASLAPRGSR